MSITKDKPVPGRPLHLRRQADHSFFANNGSGMLLFFEDPDALAHVRKAVEAAVLPANDLERVFAEQAVRNLWRVLRLGNLETAAIDVEITGHQEDVEALWGPIDPESLCHLSTRAPQTRAGIREYTIQENHALRRFKEVTRTLQTLRKGL